MLKKLILTNVGPAERMELEFADRLNLLTGDNGLGKSFILDTAWWALTRTWPAEINPKLASGAMAQPTKRSEVASIAFSYEAATKNPDEHSTFDRHAQQWKRKRGRPSNPGLVFYAMADGSFAVWDPARNSWRAAKDELIERPSAYIFSPKEVWDGLQRSDGSWLCNGLVRDWASWQKENGEAFSILKSVLHGLSPSFNDVLEPGLLTRVSLDDVRDIPTLRMGYGQDVPVLHASSGMRRIIALAYFLVWCWEEHKRAAAIIGEDPESRIVFLIDEVESHLHPKWQRSIISSLMDVLNEMSLTSSSSDGAAVQLIVGTHSPLIMGSVEPKFDAQKDAWFDIDFIDGDVIVKKRDYFMQGSAENWLKSEAFDLPSTYSMEAEAAIKDAENLLEQKNPSSEEIAYMDNRLTGLLSEMDKHLVLWRYNLEVRGLVDASN